MIQIFPDTLKAEVQTWEHPKKGPQARDIHTVEISIKGDRRRVRCHPDGRGITIFDLAVRFSQGGKVWPGSAVYWKESGNINNIRPNIDRSGWFILVGYAEDYDNSKARSQHNAVA